MLFISMSFFIIVAALMLTAMTFRLAIERRVRELGILSAVGFSPSALRGILLREAMAVATVGTVVGLAGGVGYAALLIVGLRTLWSDAVNAPFLALHATPTSLAIGAVTTLALVALTVLAVLRRLVRRSPQRLLAGEIEEPPAVKASASAKRRLPSWDVVVAFACFAATGALFAAATASAMPAAAAFFAQGGALLVGGLALLRWMLRRPTVAARIRGRGLVTLVRLGVRNARRAAGRSLLTAGLIAAATFVVVTVAASRHDPRDASLERDSGSGGFTLVARSTSPLFARLDTPDGQEKLALGERTIEYLECNEADEHVERTRVYSFRERAGDETSCLNLYRPRVPRVLGAPSDFVQRGGFAWAGSLADAPEESENPWLLLEKRPDDWPDDVVPAIGDQNTVLWILHAGVGDDIAIANDSGQEVKLRIVGLTSRSLFQGALVVAEDAFVEHFAAAGGFSTFFIETPNAVTEKLRAALEADLAEYGFDVRSSGEVLAAYQAVENTYLSTFLVLGGLGLVLGTLGLGAVLVRNVIERRGELALLRALGWASGDIHTTVLSETLWLLVYGEALGALAALLAVWPNITGTRSEVSWPLLGATLALVLLTGVIASVGALRSVSRAPVLEALRAE